MTRYQRVTWHHNFGSEPTEIYSEIDDAGVETRKVEAYRDGRRDYADKLRATGTTVLSETDMPSLKDIAAQAEFTAQLIDKAEFEDIWHLATTETLPPAEA
jgi:hypothetical protein